MRSQVKLALQALGVMLLAASLVNCGSSSTTPAATPATTYTVGGTVTGLTGTLVLYNSGADAKTITANGSFAFATALANGAAYNVTVYAQPSGQTCTPSANTGTISGANVTNVTVACTTSTTASLTLTGSGFTPRSGQTITAAILNYPTGTLVQAQSAVLPAATSASQGTFSFTFSNQLTIGHAYVIDYFTDLNGNGVCDAGIDPVWEDSTTLANVTADVAKNIAYAGNYNPNSCGTFTAPVVTPFTLTFNADITFSQTHPGKTLYVGLVQAADNVVVQRQSVTLPVTAAPVTFTFTGQLQAGQTYNVDYYADLDSNSSCNTAADHYWRAPVTTVTNGTLPVAVTGDTTITVTHTGAFAAAACGSFLGATEHTLTFASGTPNYSPHVGDALWAALVRAGDGAIIQRKYLVIDSAGNFSLIFSNVLDTGASYYVDYYADFNGGTNNPGNGTCDASDHTWRVPVSATTNLAPVTSAAATGGAAITADVFMTTIHTTNFTNVCGSF